ncbi:MAG TPA: S53 family peptidase [Terriglobales bacterium]|nr:S53 family peptidase [Terriglobales bacterium]
MAGFRKILTTLVLFTVWGVLGFSQSVVRSRIVQPVDDSQMTQLRGNINPRIQRGVDQGRMSRATKLNGVSLHFARSASQQATIEQLISEQQDSSSPNYHHWLTPEQYAERFGMSPDDIIKVSTWLRQHGLTMTEVSRTRDQVFFAGTTGQIENAFHTEFHQYVVNGEKHFANATELSVPTAFANTVLSIQNLNDFRPKPRLKKADPRFTSNLSNNTFLTPADVATIYGINGLYNAGPGFDGTGQSIAVAGETLINLNDVNNFRAAAGLPVNPPVLLLVPGSGAALNFGGNDEVESDLDVEWSGAIAPKAKIILVFTGNSQQNVFNAFEYAINNDIAPIVSMSFGACENDNGSSFVPQVTLDVQTANSFGQTVVAASGDAGATDCESASATIATQGNAVDVPAAVAGVTGVGGTTFTSDDNANANFWSATNTAGGGSALKYIPETTWNDAFGSSTGGGQSLKVPKPSYQTALTPADRHRDVPDIALAASPNHDGYLICDVHNSDANDGGACTNGFRDTGTNLVFPAGGTSFGAPEFAGIVALINQATENAAGSSNVNPTLYTLAQSTPSAFHDITTGNNKQTCQASSTGCTTANSHDELADKHSGLPVYAALFFLPLGAVFMFKGRHRAAPILAVLLIGSAVSMQVACGGGSSNVSTGGGGTGGGTTGNLSIGWSAGPGYDLVTGLGSLDVTTLANAWPGFNTAPSYSLSATQVTAPKLSPLTAGTYTVTVARASGFTGSITLSCVATGDATGDPAPNCPNPATIGTGSTTSTLTVTPSASGIFNVAVTGTSGNLSHAVNIPFTVN